ncbi:sensor histidine kinase [Cognatilysobacter bugurensis]|uniref:Two-component sensor histidine kinase n=1 Tax=Cognatilysobacter bugurensis TaxID=543356 RepID=A0A918WAU9_9GAMM|nr:histidine kinase [Lysobacter bugurensis]GHA87169.1 two-component sensor histidine kinase [Lysobacter bugurensis]
MHATLSALFRPLNLAAMCTLFAVALSLRWLPTENAGLGWALLAAFTLAFFFHDAASARHRTLGHAVLIVQSVLALSLIALSPKVGTAQVLLVIWAVAITLAWPMQVVLAALVLADVTVYLILRTHGHPAALVVTLLYAGFQGFAMLCAHYALTAERARDALARVNADLLATRALLADSARDAERLRVARELHDVAGHKLTAMSLNLHVLAADPAFAARTEVAIAQRMARELLGDLRNVVHALRDAPGLDLATALHALAAPLPRPRLALDIDDRVRIDDPALAETVLRLVQEALTNSARHGDATQVQVALRDAAGALVVAIEDDGRLRGTLREGNGLSGMRERVEERGGQLHLARSERGALRIEAVLPR